MVKCTFGNSNKPLFECNDLESKRSIIDENTTYRYAVTRCFNLLRENCFGDELFTTVLRLPYICLIFRGSCHLILQ